jgi:hypothetical protein
VTVEELVAAAEARIASDGYDAPTVLAAALECLAEAWVDDTRPLCPGCGRRRVNAAASLCTFCVEQHELKVHHKLNWWRTNAERLNAERNEARRQADRVDVDDL